MKIAFPVLAVAVLVAVPAFAVDTVYLRGQVKLADGAAPGKSVDVELVCRGSDPVRMLSTGKNGIFNLKAERDDFNHIARALPTTGMALSESTSYSGPCVLKGSLKGYDSSAIDLGNFVIGKDLKLPDLVLSARTTQK